MWDAICFKTRRSNGRSLSCIIAHANRTLRGWFGYFKHGTKRCVFQTLDRRIRMCLRSLLRKRSGRRGKARSGRDNQRRPLPFFRCDSPAAYPKVFNMYCHLSVQHVLTLGPYLSSGPSGQNRWWLCWRRLVGFRAGPRRWRLEDSGGFLADSHGREAEDGDD